MILEPSFVKISHCFRCLNGDRRPDRQTHTVRYHGDVIRWYILLKEGKRAKLHELKFMSIILSVVFMGVELCPVN